MNRQSDHGYTTSPHEWRDRAVCLAKAKLCRRLAWRHPELAARFRQYARAWLKEARTYPATDGAANP